MNFMPPLIRLNTLVRSHRIKFAAAGVADLLRIRHLFLHLDPTLACNLRCQMCAVSGSARRALPTRAFTMLELQRLGDMFFPLALQLMVGFDAEPTVYKEYVSVVRLGKKKGIPRVGLVSNGQLLSERRLCELIDCGLDEIVLSLHGVRKETYERLMVGASYERFIALIDTLTKLRESHRAPKLSLRLNYTVCPDNMEELRDFFTVFGRSRINTLQVRPMVERGGGFENPGMESRIALYDDIVSSMREDCKRHGTVLLANTLDPTFKGDGYAAVILDAVRRDITPNLVWRPDFDWQRETYDAFCRRIGWSRHLLHSALLSRAEAVQASEYAVKTALRYTVQ